ncbi:hypothetical protein CVT24_007068 [Panaeolus cyanescens]|uniref:DUF6699 domain-containing protein n=1 Tax=Panaeolus cyanescens TaxID=181874 RepID=A0A409VJR0_9AGAR|nr:hypothetical protein CVT24_007068 [Panaeolus cyanescens]
MPPHRKRVSFSGMDEIIGISEFHSHSSSLEREDNHDPVFAHEETEELAVTPATDSNFTEGSSTDVHTPRTPYLRSRELPIVDEMQIAGPSPRNSPALAFPPNFSPHSSLSSVSELSFSPGQQEPIQRTGVTESREPILSLSSHLTSGRVYRWDMSTDPTLSGSPISVLLQKSGHFPAAASMISQGPYIGDILVRHTALPWLIHVEPSDGKDYVTIRNLVVSIHTFLLRSVSDTELSRQSLLRRNNVEQIALNNSRSHVLRVDWLLGSTMFDGLILGKDGETLVLLTSMADQRP